MVYLVDDDILIFLFLKKIVWQRSIEMDKMFVAYIGAITYISKSK
jgi:hypothetical protein